MRQVGSGTGYDWQAPHAPRPHSVAPILNGPHPVAHRSSAAGSVSSPLTHAAGVAGVPAAVDALGFHLPAARDQRVHVRGARGGRARLSRFVGWLRRPRTVVAILFVGFAGLCGGLALNVLSESAPTAAPAGGEPRTSRLLPSLEAWLPVLGLGLDQVTLTGQRMTSDSDVFDALELTRTPSLIGFDGAAARARIEQLPWVASADIKRVFPGRLDIRITERKAFALWQHDGKSTLIDAGGRILTAADPKDHAELPRVVGAGAPAEAAALMELVQRHSLIASRLQYAERVDDRRWTLHLTGGVALLLPADREALALEAVANGAALARLAASGPRIIDLRAHGRFAVRRATAVQPPPLPPPIPAQGKPPG